MKKSKVISKFSFPAKAVNKSFLPLVKDKSRYLQIYGGAGSGKSYFAAQKILTRIMNEDNHRILLVRKVARTIRNSQFSLVKSLIYEYDLKKYFEFRQNDMIITNIKNGNEIITAGIDDREKLKSIHGISSIWIEEATELDRKDFLQVDLRLRGKTKNYKQIILTFNPVNSYHWLNTLTLKDCVKHKSTFMDNKFIDAEYTEVLKGLKEQDEEYYKIYALGEWGTLKNIIYQPFEIIEDYPSSFDEVIYGLDFGFNNPTALVKVCIKDNVYYLKELIYEKNLTNSDLIKKMKQLIHRRSDYIFCDPSEANRIQEIVREGFNAFPANNSVRDGIDFLKGCRIYSNPSNAGINSEVLSYSYKQDKNGNILEEPLKFNDHTMDAVRYAIYTHCKNNKQLNIRWI